MSPLSAVASAKPRSRTFPKSAGGHRFASVGDAAEYLAVNHKLIRKMIAAGKITGYRLPGSKLIRVDLNELDSLLDDGRVA